jgi:hypothetical protein
MHAKLVERRKKREKKNRPKWVSSREWKKIPCIAKLKFDFLSLSNFCHCQKGLVWVTQKCQKGCVPRHRGSSDGCVTSFRELPRVDSRESARFVRAVGPSGWTSIYETSLFFISPSCGLIAVVSFCRYRYERELYVTYDMKLCLLLKWIISAFKVPLAYAKIDNDMRIEMRLREITVCDCPRHLCQRVCAFRGLKSHRISAHESQAAGFDLHILMWESRTAPTKWMPEVLRQIFIK